MRVEQAKALESEVAALKLGPIAQELVAAEFGYKCCEKGWNLQRTLAEIERLKESK